MATLVPLAIAFGKGWRVAWWIALLVVFGATLIGKIAGIALAEWRLRAALDRLA